MAQWNNNQNQGGGNNNYGNRPSCSFDVKFRLNDNGTCPQCGQMGEFFTSQAGKPFEKCQTCLKMAGSKRQPGYQPVAPQQAYYAPTLPAPPANLQPPMPSFQPQAPAPQPQQTPDNFQLINEIKGLHDAINHLTNSIHLATAQHEQGMLLTAKALDAFSGTVDASKTYSEMV